MKKVLIGGFIIITIISCKLNYSASEIVLKQIEIAEKIANKNQSQNTKSFVDNFLENLSGIECVDKVELYHQFYGVPTNEIVNKWKQWYVENKDNFYLNTNHECLDILQINEKDRNKIVFVKNEYSNEIKSSLSKDQISTCSKLKTSIIVK